MSKKTNYYFKSSIRHIYSRMLAILIMLLLAFSVAGCSTSGTENSKVSGADEFKQYYLQKAKVDTEHDYSHMNLDALESMTSEAMGIAVDTKELTIDVQGALISGCRAEIILRVTANQLDTVLSDDGKMPRQKMQFGDESAAFLNKYNFDCLGCRYFYSDENDNLAPNQFELHYWIAQEPFDQENYTIELTDFGYYDTEKRELLPLYKGNWKVNVPLTPTSDTGRIINIEKSVIVDNYKFQLENIRLSPLGCSINMSCEEEEAYIGEHFDEIYEAFLDESKKCGLTFEDGSELDAGQFSIESSNSNDFKFFISFLSPLAVDDIASLSVFGIDFSL